MALLLRKGALSRCILAVSFRPTSSVCASRTEDSKLCSKQSLSLIFLNIQHGNRIDFRHRSTTHLQLVEIVDVERPAFVESIPEKDIQWIRRKKVFVNADDVFAKIKTEETSVEAPSPISGTIVRLLVEDSNKVTATQTIYKLETEDGESSLAFSSQCEVAVEEQGKSAETVKKKQPVKQHTEISSKMLENLEMAIKPMCSKHTSKKTAAASQLLLLESGSYVSVRLSSTLNSNDWLDCLKVGKKAKRIIEEKLLDVEKLVKEKDEKYLEAKLNQENLKLEHQSDIEKLQAELSRSSIDHLKLCNAFTPRGIMERFEFDYKLPRKLEYHGLKMDRHGWWSLAIMEEQSNFCKCLVKNGMDLKQVPDISTSLYAILSAKIHNSYPQLIVKIDGRVSMTAGRLTKDQMKVFSCLTKIFRFEVNEYE